MTDMIPENNTTSRIYLLHYMNTIKTDFEKMLKNVEWLTYPTIQQLTQTNRLHGTQKYFQGSPCSGHRTEGRTPPFTNENETG